METTHKYSRGSSERHASAVIRCNTVDGRHVRLQLADEATAGDVPRSEDASSTYAQQEGRGTMLNRRHATYPVTVSMWK